MLCLFLRKVLRIESLHGAILATRYAYANAYAYAYGGMETALDNSMGAIFLTDTHTHTLTLMHTHTDKRRHSFSLPISLHLIRPLPDGHPQWAHCSHNSPVMFQGWSPLPVSGRPVRPSPGVVCSLFFPSLPPWLTVNCSGLAAGYVGSQTP